MNNNELQTSINELRAMAAAYDRPERYYNGEHDLRFATEKFKNTFGTMFREFALNLCPIVCDALRDKLRVTGFSVEKGEAAPMLSADRAAGAVWSRNRMALRSGEVHKEVLKTGDAYVIVWPDATGRPVIYPNKAAAVSVAYDADGSGRIIRAAKYWRETDKHARLNLFYPDRIERYVSKTTTEGSPPDAKEFVPLACGDAHSAVTPNPYGCVPVFHFANNADVGAFGRSELEAAIPLQDGLNKSALDMLVAMEFSAFRQRWISGIEVEYDTEGLPVAPFAAGVEKLWITGNADARFGSFEVAELEQFLKVKDSFRVDIASVTGTPLHYFLQQTGEIASGESLRRSETRFLAKVRDRQAAFGQVWADALAFALRIEGIPSAGLITNWEDPNSMTERERLENELLKIQIGKSEARVSI